jgi:hypothetical protein
MAEDISRATETAHEAAGPKLVEEMQQMEWEPLLPVEKKLVTWSILLGVALLGILIWVSYTFFPGQ